MGDEIQIRPPKSKVDANSNQEMKYSMLDCMRYSASVHLLYHDSDNHSRTPSILPYHANMRPYQYLLLIFKWLPGNLIFHHPSYKGDVKRGILPSQPNE